MKKFTKILSLLLAVMMLLSLVACDKPEKDDDTVVGKWEVELDGDVLGEMLGMYDVDMKIKTSVDLYFEFDKDGEGAMSFNESDMKKFYKEVAELTLDMMAEEYGISADDFLAAMEMTKDEYLDAAVEEMDADALTLEYTYTVDDDELTINTEDGGKTVITFEFDDGDLVMTDAEEEGAEEIWEILVPLTLERA